MRLDRVLTTTLLVFLNVQIATSQCLPLRICNLPDSGNTASSAPSQRGVQPNTLESGNGVSPIFFAVDDFSATANPTGTWSYGYTEQFRSPFIRYTTIGTTTFSNEIGWFGPVPPFTNSPGYPLVVVSEAGKPRVLDMGPGPNGEYSVVRWTAPSSGLWDVSGEFDGLGSTSSDVHILHNNRDVFARALNNSDVQVFAVKLTLQIGDTIDFAVGYGPDKNFDFDSTGLRAVVLPHEYDYEKVDFPGAAQTQVFGFNDRGTVVGNYTDGQGIVHGFVYRNRNYVSIDYPGSLETGFLGINNADKIAGYYRGADERYHGFLLSESEYTPISYPGTLDTVAWDVNELGDVVGGYDFTDQNTVIGFLDHHDSFTSFQDPVAPPGATQADAINDHGQIVGVYVDTDNSVHGFLLQHGIFSPVEFPGGVAGGEAEGINNNAEIAGRYFGGRGGSLGFIRSGLRFTTVVFPGAAVCAARKINNHGIVVGIYRQEPSQPLHGFIATPATAPEQ